MVHAVGAGCVQGGNNQPCVCASDPERMVQTDLSVSTLVKVACCHAVWPTWDVAHTLAFRKYSIVIPQGVHRVNAGILQEGPELVPAGQQGGGAEGRCDDQHNGQNDGAHLQAEGLRVTASHTYIIYKCAT